MKHGKYPARTSLFSICHGKERDHQTPWAMQRLSRLGKRGWSEFKIVHLRDMFSFSLPKQKNNAGIASSPSLPRGSSVTAPVLWGCLLLGQVPAVARGHQGHCRWQRRARSSRRGGCISFPANGMQAFLIASLGIFPALTCSVSGGRMGR